MVILIYGGNFNERRKQTTACHLFRVRSGIDSRNSLWLIKGDNPLHILNFPKEKMYVYASTEEILWRALIETEIFESIKTGNYEQIKIGGGDILRISADGELEYAKFNYTDYSGFGYCNW